MIPATRPARSESLPRVADTTVEVWRLSCTGRAPYRSTRARSFDCRSLKLPVICPDPPVIASVNRGADLTTPSSTIATCFWRYLVDRSDSCLVPFPVVVKSTFHAPLVVSKDAWADLSAEPSISAGPSAYRPPPEAFSSVGKMTVWVGSSSSTGVDGIWAGCVEEGGAPATVVVVAADLSSGGRELRTGRTPSG